MKLVMDERVKHRLVGLAVILSIGAIFAPAIMKKSNQRLDGNMNVSVQLPPKPAQPDVDMVAKKEMFDTVKIAHVELPDSTDAKLAKAEPIGQLKSTHTESVKPAGQTLALADEESNFDSADFSDPDQDLAKQVSAPVATKTNAAATAHKVTKLITTSTVKPVSKPKVVVQTIKVAKTPVKHAPKPAVKTVAKKIIKNGYAVQLATFTSQHNADSLVSRLKGKGYTAIYNKIKTNEGMIYKVLVGQLRKKEQAQQLQQQLVNAVQIRGFIVTSGEG